MSAFAHLIQFLSKERIAKSLFKITRSFISWAIHYRIAKYFFLLFFFLSIFDIKSITFMVMSYSSIDLIFSITSVDWNEFRVLDIRHTKVILNNRPCFDWTSQSLFTVITYDCLVLALSNSTLLFFLKRLESDSS
jgi:hypothetical protein